MDAKEVAPIELDARSREECTAGAYEVVCDIVAAINRAKIMDHAVYAVVCYTPTLRKVGLTLVWRHVQSMRRVAVIMVSSLQMACLKKSWRWRAAIPNCSIALPWAINFETD